jgi:hypothetical protein
LGEPWIGVRVMKGSRGGHHDHVYQTQHLVIISPSQLRRMLAGAMLDVIDAREWTDVQPGQAYLCRARR